MELAKEERGSNRDFWCGRKRTVLVGLLLMACACAVRGGVEEEQRRREDVLYEFFTRCGGNAVSLDAQRNVRADGCVSICLENIKKKRLKIPEDWSMLNGLKSLGVYCDGPSSFAKKENVCLLKELLGRLEMLRY